MIKPVPKPRNFLKHSSAKSSHYDAGSETYDVFNENDSKVINHTIERILNKHKVKTVLDLTCGTGSQVFWLKECGYDVIGSDINVKMLEVARQKAKQMTLDIKFITGDMRTLKVGTFDAVITIFNAIGHLTKNDFVKTIRNIHKNLNAGGVYIFDIFNFTYLLKDDHITRLTIDWQKNADDMILREIQYSTIDHEGILASFTTSYEQKGSQKPKILRSQQTLQVYSTQHLKELLHENGFTVLEQGTIDGSKFDDSNSDRILTAAKKD